MPDSLKRLLISGTTISAALAAPSRFLGRSDRTLSTHDHFRSILSSPLRPSTLMHWVARKNQGPPPTDFVGGFQIPKM